MVDIHGLMVANRRERLRQFARLSPGARSLRSMRPLLACRTAGSLCAADGSSMPTTLSTPAAAGAPAAYDGFDRMLLNGRWTHGRSGQSVEDVDPYTNDVLLRIPLADQADLDDAFAAAAAAQPAWSRAQPATRAAVLRRAAAIMESRRAEIVDWLVHESGSTRIKAELEWNMARAVTLEASSFPSSAEGVMLAADIPGKESRIYRQPVGVVGMISPWNFPLHLSSRSVAPAIALGNAVVVKPASDTPVSGGLLLAKDLRGGRTAGRSAQRADRQREHDRRCLRPSSGATRDFVHRIDGGRPPDHGSRRRESDHQAGAARARRQLPVRGARRRRPRSRRPRRRLRQVSPSGADLHGDQPAHRGRERSTTSSSSASRPASAG